MRVALISFDFPEVVLALANGLCEHAKVAVALPTRQLDPVREHLDPRVTVLPFGHARLREPTAQARICARILDQVRGFAPDVVHLQQGHLYFNLALRRLAVPLVVTIHDHTVHPGDRLSAKTPQVAMNIAFRRADRVIVHAEQLRREVIARRGIPAGRIDVIPHVAIGGLGRPSAGPAAPQPSHDVLFFGRIWAYKGLEYLIRAQPLVSARIAEARFVIAGTGEPFARYRAMMADPGRFEVHNEFVSPERRAELFERAAVVVLPYVEASQSGVIPVAYAFARPVVATRIGGLVEAVEDGRTGLLVPPRDEHALADAIVALLGDPARARAMGLEGLRKEHLEWSPAIVAEQTMQTYAQALADSVLMPTTAAIQAARR